MIYIQPDQWTNDDSISTDVLQMSTGTYYMQSANEPWSFSSPDNNILRFEVQPGDHWVNDGPNQERAEIASATPHLYGTPLDVSYGFMIEPGAANTAAWLVVGQWHQNDFAGQTNASPPFAISMIGEKMAVTIGWTNSANVNQYTNIYVAPTNITRGQYYNMNIAANFNPAGGGQLLVTCNGQTLASYTGPLGIAQGHTGVYWKEGIYEAPSTETLAVDYKNLNIASGGSILSASSTPALPSGAASVAYSYAANNVVSVETVTNLDQSRIVYTYNTTGAYYLSSYLGYSPTGQVTKTVDYNPNGTRSFADVLNADGSELTTHYDGNGNLTVSTYKYVDGDVSIQDYVNNAVTEKYIQYAAGGSTDIKYNSAGAVTKLTQIYVDGSKQVQSYGITGQTYVSELDTFNAAGVLTSLLRDNAAGTLVFSQTLNAQGTTTVDQFTAAGVLQISTATTSGGVVTTDWYGSNGAISSARVSQPGGSYVYDTYSTAGALTQQIDAIPGVSSIAYDYTGAKTAAGTPQYTKVVTALEGGLSFASDGVNDTFNSFGGDTFAFSSGFGTDVVNNFHAAAGANQDLIQLSKAIVPGFSNLALRQSGADTLLTIDGADSIRLTGVNVSSFSHADVKFM